MADRSPEKVITPRKDNSEYAAFARRAVRGLAKRAAAGDVELLADLAGLADVLDGLTRDAMDTLRTDYGYSWTDIARVLGVTRQAARQRWSDTP